MPNATPESDAADARTYFEIEPATDAVAPAGLEDAFRRMHDQRRAFELECLVVAGGDGVDYYLGADAEHAGTLEHTLNDVFPDETTISTPDTIPDVIIDELGPTAEPGETPTAEPAPEPDPIADASTAESSSSGDREASAEPGPDTETASDGGTDTGHPTETVTEPTDPEPERSQDPQAADRRLAASVRYPGGGKRRNDWQMQLRDAVEPEAEIVRSPLAGLVDTLADAADETTAVYQALLEPHADWSFDERARRDSLRREEDTTAQWLKRLWNEDFERADPQELQRSNRKRLEELDAAAPSTSWTVTARAYLEGPDAQAVARDLESVFGSLDGDYYELLGVHETGADARDVLADIKERTMRTDYGLLGRLARRLPFISTTWPAVVTDPQTAPAFCILDGDALTQSGRQAIDTTHGERAGVTPPTDEQLDLYDTTGLTIGRLLDENDERTETTVSLPPALQSLHVAWFGKTGSGKSVAVECGIFDNLEATDGPAVILDTKGDGMGEDFLKAYYWKYGDLDDVYYFECDRYVPAISFFDIRDELEAGVPRATAVQESVDHYIQLIKSIMGEDAFESKRAEDLIRHLLEAMYDPVHGDDAFTHSEFSATVQRMANRGEPPAVTDPTLERKLAGFAENRSDVFASVMQGVAGRIEKATRDRRLASLFEHTPPRATASTDDDAQSGVPDEYPSFDFDDHVNEDSVIVIDTGGLRETAQREMVLVILSRLWAALRNRDRRRREDPSIHTDLEPDPPLVNLYVEEAADVADTQLMNNLLSKSRSFGLSVTLTMQFPAQLREAAPRTYHEVLNNISTIVTGNVGRDRPLAESLATDDMDPGDVANRLRGLRRGQWLVELPAEIFDHEPRPFLLESADPPAGHPASDEPLSPAWYTAFDAALYRCKERTREEAGLTVAQPSVVDTGDAATPGADDTDKEVDAEDAGLRPRVDTTLPYTKRLPDHLEYDADRHALTCTGCDAVYDPDRVGLERALDCCPAGEVDPDDIPICEANLKLTREERLACEYTDAQLMFLQAVYNAGQFRYDPPMYDLLSDSMLRLREYVGIDADAIHELLDDGLLRHDTDHPHRLYTVSPDGRELLGERHRHGVIHGDGKGDLSESSQHAMSVEGVRQLTEQQYSANPDSEVAEIRPYYELDEDDIAEDADVDIDLEAGSARRLDLAGLDSDGNVVLVVEVERVNNDVAEAVPADYDKMAACDPDEAIWVVMTQSAGHDVLQALNDSGRVDKTYSETTPPQNFRIDEPGLTEMYTVNRVLDQLE